MVKKGYYGNNGLSLAWDLGVIFQAYQIVRSASFSEKKFFNVGLKGVMEKCVSCSLVYLFLKTFLIKKV